MHNAHIQNTHSPHPPTITLTKKLSLAVFQFFTMIILCKPMKSGERPSPSLSNIKQKLVRCHHTYFIISWLRLRVSIFISSTIIV